MKQQDKQFVALATLPDGSVQLVDYRMPEGLTHHIVRQSGNLDRIKLDLRDIIAPNGYQDALKVSRVRNAEITAGDVRGGSEDCLDMTDCHDVLVVMEDAYPMGRYVSTTKGGSTNCQIVITKQHGHGKETDHDLGNWFDYNKRKTTGIELDVEVHDGSKPRARAINADAPIVPPDQAWEISLPWWRRLFAPVMTILKALRIA